MFLFSSILLMTLIIKAFGNSFKKSRLVGRGPGGGLTRRIQCGAPDAAVAKKALMACIR